MRCFKDFKNILKEFIFSWCICTKACCNYYYQRKYAILFHRRIAMCCSRVLFVSSVSFWFIQHHIKLTYIEVIAEIKIYISFSLALNLKKKRLTILFTLPFILRYYYVPCISFKKPRAHFKFTSRCCYISYSCPLKSHACTFFRGLKTILNI